MANSFFYLKNKKNLLISTLLKKNMIYLHTSKGVDKYVKRKITRRFKRMYENKKRY